jgi:hypothetical protein
MDQTAAYPAYPYSPAHRRESRSLGRHNFLLRLQIQAGSRIDVQSAQFRGSNRKALVGWSYRSSGCICDFGQTSGLTRILAVIPI